jgi:uncharacterized heparinase superfamily protein
MRVSPVPSQLRKPAGLWQRTIAKPNPQLAANRFHFLNQEYEIQTWNDTNIPKLWLYNLHYCACPTSALIDRWIQENPPGKGNGWEPYPLSLRIANWIKWSLDGNCLSDLAVQSLALQANYLARSIEFHLLANHLFGNAKALVFAGVFLSSLESKRWLKAGLDILSEQISEQILADGAHFERSPMYHALILEDLLDLINLASVFPRVLDESTREHWSMTASRMLGWLSSLCHPDGQISFFNDAAFGVAPDPADLFAYASRLGIAPNSCQLSDSGYIRLEHPDATVLFDAAPIGPDYQPGHAHSDTLSFELSIRGRRVLVNSGTATYENCTARHLQRGTAAHNTVRIDRQNQSETWSAFRVARRARPSNVTTDHNSYAQGAHTGYLRLKDPVWHFRRLDLLPDALVVTDRMEGSGMHEIEIFFHLHPDAEVSIDLDQQLSGAVEESAWFPEFNLSIPSKTIIGRWSGQCPVQFTTRISLL